MLIKSQYKPTPKLTAPNHQPRMAACLSDLASPTTRTSTAKDAICTIANDQEGSGPVANVIACTPPDRVNTVAERKYPAGKEAACTLGNTICRMDTQLRTNVCPTALL